MTIDLISRQAAIDALADMHCKSDENGVSVFDGGFCNYGERKEGEGRE